MLRLRNFLIPPRVSDLGRDERGSTTLENVIIWPSVIIFIFGMVQFGLWLHARDVAHGAATAAYYEARLLNSTDEAGRMAGTTAVDASNGTITGPVVTVTRTATTVTATVTGGTSMVIPGWPGSAISETVTGPIERYVGP